MIELFKPSIKTIDMLYKTCILFALLSLNFISLSGQAIYYDYDESGNRVKRYIVLSKGSSSGDDTLKKYEEIIKSEEFADKLEELTIKIYPNPTRGQLTVEINGLGLDETVDYQLFSQTGLLLGTNNKNGFYFTIDMEKYPDGLYILRLMINGKISQWKILKE
jgi:hypothetical protein